MKTGLDSAFQRDGIQRLFTLLPFYLYSQQVGFSETCPHPNSDLPLSLSQTHTSTHTHTHPLTALEQMPASPLC